jgi:predicted transposase YbfD/YdcC
LVTLFPPELIAALHGTPERTHEGQRPPDIEQAETVEKGHGRIEIRRLSISRECIDHLDWPGAAQICRIERHREKAGKVSREIAYAVTGIPRERAGPDQLLALWRDHWRIENTLHWRRDVVLREDASQIRSGTIPQAMAAMRNTVLRLAHKPGQPIAAAREAFAENRYRAIHAVKTGIL